MLTFLSFFDELDDELEPFSKEHPEPSRRGDEPTREPGRRGGGGDGFDGGDDGGRGGSRLGGRGLKRPSGPQLQRLIVLIIVLIGLLVFGVWYVQKCQREDEVNAYKGYVRNANAIATQSNAIGRDFTTALIKPGQTEKGLIASIDKELSLQRAVFNDANKLSGPDGVKGLTPSLAASMQYRVLGLEGLAKQLRIIFATPVASMKDTTASVQVAYMYERLLAADVVYEDQFKAPMGVVLADKSITDAPIVDSRWIGPDYLQFQDPLKMRARLAAIIGGAGSATGPGSTTSGPRGTGIAGVKYQPGNVPMQVGKENDVAAGSGNSSQFDVTVQNSGSAQETSLKVTLIIGGKPVGDPQEIVSLDPGQSAAVSFPVEATIGQVQSVRAKVDPVPGETNTANNIFDFKVLFQLGK